jgi:hypothetical protein
MANANKPFGLRPVRSLTGADWDGRGNVYHIISTDSTSSYHIGDVVRLSGTADANGIPGIVKTVAGDGGTLGQGAVGVIIGVGINPGGPYVNQNDLTKLYAPQTKAQDYYALVADDPNLLFEVQEIGTGTPLAATAVGLNCNLSITAAHTGFQSTTVLDNSTELGTIGLDVKLMRLAQKADNAFGAYAKWIVMLNSHAYRAAITGI